ncbi:Tfp pilus assembly protein FimT/FimU [Planctomycetota bacterium]
MLRTSPTARARPTRSSRAGFTLIELLVTIGIMLFVLGVTIVGFSAMFRNVGVRSGARVLRAAIDGAKIRAIQQRRHIRFEAQLVPGSTTHRWRVTSSAGDQAREWRSLPDFVAVATNAGQSVAGVDDSYRDGTYRGAAGESGTLVHQIAVTFGPDGSVKRWKVGGARQPDDSFAVVTNNDEKDPTSLFAIRLTNMRDTRGTAPLQRWLVIIPLTGGFLPYDAGS